MLSETKDPVKLPAVTGLEGRTVFGEEERVGMLRVLIEYCDILTRNGKVGNDYVRRIQILRCNVNFI